MKKRSGRGLAIISVVALSGLFQTVSATMTESEYRCERPIVFQTVACLGHETYPMPDAQDCSEPLVVTLDTAYCPAPETPRHQTLRLHFKAGRYHLRPEMLPQIEQAVQQLKPLRPDQVLLIEGHTDAIGCQADNLRLSWNRAEAVRRYIVRNGLLRAEQVRIIGYGETRPVATNQTSEGRASNRRIELKVLQRNQLSEGTEPSLPQALAGYHPRPGRCPQPDKR